MARPTDRNDSAKRSGGGGYNRRRRTSQAVNGKN